MNTNATVLMPGTAPAVWVLRDRVSFLGSLPGSDCVLLEVEVAPGAGTPPHRHDSPEVFRVLEGELRIGLFDEQPPREIVAVPGTVVRIPAKAAHNYRNVTAVPARTLALVEQGMADFFHELGSPEPAPARPPTESELAMLAAICARHKIEILGGTPGPH